MQTNNNIEELLENVDQTIVINILKRIERTIEKSIDIFSDAIEIKKSIESLKSDEQKVVSQVLTDCRKLCLAELEVINQNKLNIEYDNNDEKLLKLMFTHRQHKKCEEIIELVQSSWDFIEQRQETVRRFQKKMQSSAGCAQIIEPDEV
jgi:hypothetical protein